MKDKPLTQGSMPKTSDKSHTEIALPNATLTAPLCRIVVGLRWYIIALVFVATCINYIDRSSIGLLFTDFGRELGISREQYGWIGAILLFAYTVSQSVSGRLYDRFGSRIG